MRCGPPTAATAAHRCRYPPHTAKIGSPGVQTFNGTAQPDHRATHPLLVTNARFTQDAEAAAARYEISLVDRTALRTWAIFGKPLELDRRPTSPPRRTLQLSLNSVPPDRFVISWSKFFAGSAGSCSRRR